MVARAGPTTRGDACAPVSLTRSPRSGDGDPLRGLDTGPLPSSFDLMEVGVDHVLATSAEVELLQRLRAGDERAFEALVAKHSRAMLTVARTYVKTNAAAEEVVQDAWLGVLKGLAGFEGRSSIRTWIMRIVVNIARTRGVRDARSVPFSSLVMGGDDAAVSPDRFRAPDEAFAGHWSSYPRDWRSLPEETLLEQETIEVVIGEIGELPVAQQTVIRLRDIEGWSAGEVCAALELSDGNQRVLLHRARSRVRGALERHFDV
jgi:RNA polymerase sigma-70 factor, ECF subfamily